MDLIFTVTNVGFKIFKMFFVSILGTHPLSVSKMYHKSFRRSTKLKIKRLRKNKNIHIYMQETIWETNRSMYLVNVRVLCLLRVSQMSEGKKYISTISDVERALFT